MLSDRCLLVCSDKCLLVLSESVYNCLGQVIISVK